MVISTVLPRMLTLTSSATVGDGHDIRLHTAVPHSFVIVFERPVTSDTSQLASPTCVTLMPRSAFTALPGSLRDRRPHTGICQIDTASSAV